MAYDPLNPQKDDETEAAPSQYASLLAPAAPTGMTAGPTAAPTPAAPTNTVKSAPAHAGFVNFDRILNANRSTAEHMQQQAQTTENKQVEALRSGFQAAQNDVNSKIQAPVRPPEVNYDSPLPGGPRDTYLPTYQDATRGAQAQYTGPSQTDVQSRYAPLLQAFNQYKDGYRAPTGLDAQLFGAVGGLDTSGRQAVEREYGDALAKSQTAASEGEKAANDAKSKWGALLGDMNEQYRQTQERDSAKASADRRMNDLKKDFNALAGDRKDFAQYMSKATPEEWAQVIDYGRRGGQLMFQQAIGNIKQKYGT